MKPVLKRIMIGICTAALLFSGGATSAFAHGHHGGGHGYYYIDKDGDGICDHLGIGCGGHSGHGHGRHC